jgi:hypothetical protein
MDPYGPDGAHKVHDGPLRAPMWLPKGPHLCWLSWGRGQGKAIEFLILEGNRNDALRRNEMPCVNLIVTNVNRSRLIFGRNSVKSSFTKGSQMEIMS